MSVAAVVLAAGASRRLGRAKQMVEIGGEALLHRAVRVAMEAELSPVIVVIRAKSEPGDELAAALRRSGCAVIVNDQPDEGIASSIRCGIAYAAALQVDGAVLMTCDQVAQQAKHLRALCDEIERVTGSCYAGRVGIPAYFPAAKFGELMELQGDVGARALLRDAASVVDEALGLDVDTTEDLARARMLLGDPGSGDERTAGVTDDLGV